MLVAKLGHRGRENSSSAEDDAGGRKTRWGGKREHAIPLIKSARNKEVLVPSNF